MSILILFYAISVFVNIILVNALYGIKSVDLYYSNDGDVALLLIFFPILNFIATIVISIYLIYKGIIRLFTIMKA